MSKWTSALKKSLIGNPNGLYMVENSTFLSYQDIYIRAKKLSEMLINQETKVVSCLLTNSFEYIILFLACAFSGKIFAPIPYFLNVSEVKKILKYHESKVLFTDRKDIEFKGKVFGSTYIFNILEEKINLKTSADFLTTDDTIMSLYYSSGTTGNPKGVLYSHKNIYSLIRSICNDFKFSKDSKHLAFLPFGHTAALNYSVFPALFLGFNLYISQHFDNIRSGFFKTLDKFQIDYVQTVPTIIGMLIKLSEDVSNYNFQHIKFVGCGSSFLSKENQNKFFEKFNLPVANLYGLSETGPTHIDNPTTRDWKPGSIGVPLSVNKCKISPEGELMIKGDNVFVGYHKNNDLYNKVVIDGWFYTGDYGYQDKSKYFFKDRKKDLVIIGGMNVYPAEIEEVLSTIRYIEESCVFGIDDPINGEYLVAYVVLNNLRTSFEISKFIRDELRTKLSNFKIPREIIMVSELPKTASGKILKRELKNLHLEKIINAD